MYLPTFYPHWMKALWFIFIGDEIFEGEFLQFCFIFGCWNNKLSFFENLVICSSYFTLRKAEILMAFGKLFFTTMMACIAGQWYHVRLYLAKQGTGSGLLPRQGTRQKRTSEMLRHSSITGLFNIHLQLEARTRVYRYSQLMPLSMIDNSLKSSLISSWSNMFGHVFTRQLNRHVPSHYLEKNSCYTQNHMFCRKKCVWYFSI